MTPKQFGRFTVDKTLGKGAQGTVYLATDPHLERQVAIKTLNAAADKNLMPVLLGEARIASKLQHPNIVTLYDAGEQAGVPYLVFEYVEGEPLNQRLRTAALKPGEAVDLVCELLEGLAYAHQQGVIHRDIKPGNIMLNTQGIPRLMDFGIATRLVKEATEKPEMWGTPQYMAPEVIQDRVFGPATDVFAVGMVLYECLSGRPAISSRNVFETLNRMVSEPFEPLIQRNAQVDEKLNALVMRAIAKAPAERFASAEELRHALLQYKNPDDDPDNAAGSEARHATMEYLLRRMRQKSDFPAFSSTISSVNRIVSNESESMTKLANAIVRDVALTNKILKTVNTVNFSQYGGSITTISKAIAILGFNTVRSVAVSLMLFDHLQNKAHAAQMQDEVIATYFGGLLATRLAGRCGVKDREEAMICAMFHTLGRLLITYYLHEDAQEIKRLTQSGKSEEQASRQVLGISSKELGQEIARQWHFPERIVQTMRPWPPGKVDKPKTPQDSLRVIAGMASELALALEQARPEQMDQALGKLAERFAVATGINKKDLVTEAGEATQQLTGDAKSLGIAPTTGSFLMRMNQLTKPEPSKAAGTKGKAATTEASDSSSGATILETPGPETLGGGAALQTAEQVHAMLTGGIQDVTMSLVGEYNLNDVLRMILETMYRSIGFDRVLLLVRDVKQPVLVGRIGFGPDIDRIRQTLRMPLQGDPDVFRTALNQNADIFIQDTEAENIRSRIPEWYRALIPGRTFVIFPIVIDKRPIGLIYGDMGTPNSLSVGTKELSLLKTMRNQAVLAIKQKMMGK